MNEKYIFYKDCLDFLYKRFEKADNMKSTRFYILEMMKILCKLDDIKLEELSNEEA